MPAISVMSWISVLCTGLTLRTKNVSGTLPGDEPSKLLGLGGGMQSSECYTGLRLSEVKLWISLTFYLTLMFCFYCVSLNSYVQSFGG